MKTIPLLLRSQNYLDAWLMVKHIKYQEAVSNAEIIINEWIETAKELGREIPRAKGRLLFA